MSKTNNPVLGPLLTAWILGWPTGAVRALVAMKGWEWFVADTFGWYQPSLVETWGLFGLISFATLQIDTDPDDGTSNWIRAATGLTQSLVASGIWFLSLLILSGFR